MTGVSGLRGDLRRTARLALAWTGGVAAVTVLAVSGYGWAVTDALDAATVRADIFGRLDGRPADSPATDILIVGSDTRIGLGSAALDAFHAGSQAAADGARSDTMILAQLSADRKSLTLLSIPRDSYVDIPATAQRPEHHDKINSALNLGGPALTVSTVEQATGIHIDHFLQVDFESFAQIVDALGGVDVCLPEAADDPLSGLKLPAGVSHVGGVQALAYVRARYTLTGGSDLGRIRRQQEFLGTLASRVESSDVLADPVRFSGLVRAIASSMQADSGLSTETMIDLALAVKALPGDQIKFVSMPLADADYSAPGVGSTVLWDPTLSERLFQAMQQDKPVDEIGAVVTPPVPSPAPAPSISPTTDSASATVAGRHHRRRAVVRPAAPSAPTSLTVRTAQENACHL